jgi:hypothetical protein
MFIGITPKEIAHEMSEREKKLHQEELRSLARDGRSQKDNSKQGNKQVLAEDSRKA